MAGSRRLRSNGSSATAADLYRSAPWESACDDQILRDDIPDLNEGACLSIIGALGESLGFVLFPSEKGY